MICVEVCQSQTLTCLAMCSSVTRHASTCVRIDSVSTSCSIHTWITAAFVNVYKNNIQSFIKSVSPIEKYNVPLYASLYDRVVQFHRMHKWRRCMLDIDHPICHQGQFVLGNDSS